jgi:hypothetical protein
LQFKTYAKVTILKGGFETRAGFCRREGGMYEASGDDSYRQIVSDHLKT